MTRAVIILEMGHTRQCQPRVLPLRELSPSCKTTSRRAFPPLRQRSWALQEPRQRAEPTSLWDGCRAPGCSLQTPLAWEGWGSRVPLHLRWKGVLSRAKRTPPFSCTVAFTLDFFTCFPDLPEALNLPNASLPSNSKMGCGKFFFFFFFFGLKRD